MNRSDSTSSKVVAANFAEDTFDALFNRFRKEVLLKVTRNDLTSNNDILRSIFNKLVDVVTAFRTEYKKSQVEKGLNLVEFKMGIRIVFQNVIPAFKLEECSALFVYFDSNKDGRIGPEDFVVGIKGKLNMYRSSLIDFVFQLLDRNCDGVIDEKDMVAYLLKTGTPGILQGKMLSPKKKSQELIRRIGKRGDDKATGIYLKDLQDFYIDRGLFVVDDVMFKFDVLDDWLLSDELATIYLRNVAPNFDAAGASCRGDNNETVQQGALMVIKRERTISHGMDLEELSKAEGTSGKSSSQSASAPVASPPPTAKPSTNDPSPRQAAANVIPSPEKSSAVLALEQQQKQLQQQMEMMKIMQAKQLEQQQQQQQQPSSSPTNVTNTSEKSLGKKGSEDTLGSIASSPKRPAKSSGSFIMPNEKLNELVATVRMLTRQLEEQNTAMKVLEAKLVDCEKTVTEQTEVIASQQSMIGTQQAIIAALQKP